LSGSSTARWRSGRIRSSSSLTGAAANMLVIGCLQAGKSMLLRTLVLSACYMHTPREVVFYMIDEGRGGLRGMVDLPGDPDLVRRVWRRCQVR
jgi:hypothetical protein